MRQGWVLPWGECDSEPEFKFLILQGLALTFPDLSSSVAGGFGAPPKSPQLSILPLLQNRSYCLVVASSRVNLLSRPPGLGPDTFPDHSLGP